MPVHIGPDCNGRWPRRAAPGRRDASLRRRISGRGWVQWYRFHLLLVSKQFDGATSTLTITLTPTPTGAVPYQVYRGFLSQNVRMCNLAESYAGAVASPPDYVQDSGDQYSVPVYRPNPGDPRTVNRAFMRYDLPDVDAGDVVSAALVLYPKSVPPSRARLRSATAAGATHPMKARARSLTPWDRISTASWS